jgi:hypothetical protein
MSFQAYLDNIKAKTGKTPQDFGRLAAEKGLTKHGEITAWLKAEEGLGHGHANAVVAALRNAGAPRREPEQKLDALFSGKKAIWRGSCDALIADVGRFGPDVSAEANRTYVNLLRGGKKFGIIQCASVERLDIGVKLKGVAAEGRLQPAGSWNAMVTHRVSVTDPNQIDAELLAWLKRAYAAV